MKNIIKCSIVAVLLILAPKMLAMSPKITPHGLKLPAQSFRAYFVANKNASLMLYRVNSNKMALVNFSEPEKSVFIESSKDITNYGLDENLGYLNVRFGDFSYFVYDINNKKFHYGQEVRKFFANTVKCRFVINRSKTLVAAVFNRKSIIYIDSNNIRNFKIIPLFDDILNMKFYAENSLVINGRNIVNLQGFGQSSATSTVKASRKVSIEYLSKDYTFSGKLFNDGTLHIFPKSSPEKLLKEIKNVGLVKFLTCSKGNYMLVERRNKSMVLVTLFGENGAIPILRELRTTRFSPCNRYLTFFENNSAKLFDLHKKKEIELNIDNVDNVENYDNYYFVKDKNGDTRYFLLKKNNVSTFVYDFYSEKLFKLCNQKNVNNRYDLYSKNPDQYTLSDLLLYDKHKNKLVEIKCDLFSEKVIKGFRFIRDNCYGYGAILFGFQDGSSLVFDLNDQIFLSKENYKPNFAYKLFAIKAKTDHLLRIYDTDGKCLLRSKKAVEWFDYYDGLDSSNDAGKFGEFCIFRCEDSSMGFFNCKTKTNIQVADSRLSNIDKYFALRFKDNSVALFDSKNKKQIKLNDSALGCMLNVKHFGFSLDKGDSYFFVLSTNGLIKYIQLYSSSLEKRVIKNIDIESCFIKIHSRYVAIKLKSGELLLIDDQKHFLIKKFDNIAWYQLVEKDDSCLLLFGDNDHNLNVFDVRKNKIIIKDLHAVYNYDCFYDLKYLAVGFGYENKQGIVDKTVIKIFDLNNLDNIVHINYNRPLDFTFDYDYSSAVLRLSQEKGLLEKAKVYKHFVPLLACSNFLGEGDHDNFINIEYKFSDKFCYGTKKDAKNPENILVKFGNKNYLESLEVRKTGEKRKRSEDDFYGQDLTYKKRRVN